MNITRGLSIRKAHIEPAWYIVIKEMLSDEVGKVDGYSNDHTMCTPAEISHAGHPEDYFHRECKV